MITRLLAIALCFVSACAWAHQTQKPSQEPPQRTSDVTRRASGNEQNSQTNQPSPAPTAPIQAGNTSPDRAEVARQNRQQPEDQFVTVRGLPSIDVRRDFLDYTGILLSVVLLSVAAYQIKLLKDTVTATKDAANAAKSNAAAAQSNAAAAETSTAIARATLLLTHRPKVVIRNVHVQNLVDGHLGAALNGHLWMTNVGFTRARVLRVHTEWFIGERLPMKNPIITAEVEHIDVKLMPGRSKQLPVATYELTTDDHFAVYGSRDDQRELYLLGIIKYWDELKNMRRTVFCRRWNRASRRFDVIEDIDYEYAD